MMSAIDRLNSVNYRDAIQTGEAYQASESILIVPFWKPWFCQMVIDAADEHDDYHPYDPDVNGDGTAPGQECRITEFSPWLYDRWVEHWQTIMRWVVGDFYRMHYLFDREGIYRRPFVLKYTMDTQRSMTEHNDASTISFSMVLNGDYEGNYLWFPRQKWSNRHVPIGWGTVFPGQVTHPHLATELKSGKRYGLTGWIKDK